MSTLANRRGAIVAAHRSAAPPGQRLRTMLEMARQVTAAPAGLDMVWLMEALCDPPPALPGAVVAPVAAWVPTPAQEAALNVVIGPWPPAMGAYFGPGMGSFVGNAAALAFTHFNRA